ncbi:MAG TPA: N-acetylornithine carbamoyltransferase [Saprospiraceae bacterium]|nr:N-acetylornithine carbamoyltransferase [Saprospiraceae bacterium]HMQ83294.1 N-acetylornithine carbamoyltransferase [Saprospiraceae bacterium]
MQHFTSIKDVAQPETLLELAKTIKARPFDFQPFGKNKTLGLLFLNPSLRTRMSTQKAAQNLGMNVMVMNLNSEGWNIELEDGTIMDQGSQEHIKEAAGVISQYCDIIGIRTFASLKSREEDYGEKILNKFIQHAQVPIISLESATLHPLQSLADWLTIEEQKKVQRPKVVLSWAPHPRALPQAVANSFVEWMKQASVELIVAHPPGFELAAPFVTGVNTTTDQLSAFADADFIYAKNWSSYENYGAIGQNLSHWIIDQAKMELTQGGQFMHCLPVRRNVVVSDAVLDGNSSIVLEQANNRTYAAQAVLLAMCGGLGQ